MTKSGPIFSIQILRGINLEINRGDFVGITGPSGAGKTTLCMCLKGLIPHVVGGTMRGREAMARGR